MLIVSRGHLEAVVIVLPDGSQVRISVRLLRPEAVSLGIEAPGSVQVWREELGAPMSAARRELPELVFPCPSCGTLLVELHGAGERAERHRRFSCRACGLVVVRAVPAP